MTPQCQLCGIEILSDVCSMGCRRPVGPPTEDEKREEEKMNKFPGWCVKCKTRVFDDMGDPLIGCKFDVRREGYVWTLEIVERLENGNFFAESPLGGCQRELSEEEAREAVRYGVL